MTGSELTNRSDDRSTSPAEVFLLKVEPSEIVFVGNLLERIRTLVTIHNRSGIRQAFKIRCSSNEAFRISPPLGIIHHTPAEVELIYRGDKNTQPAVGHHFTVYHIPAPYGCTPEGVWEEHYGRAQGKKHFPVSFAYQ